jgi:hypothetical protein
MKMRFCYNLMHIIDYVINPSEVAITFVERYTLLRGRDGLFTLPRKLFPFSTKS